MELNRRGKADTLTPKQTDLLSKDSKQWFLECSCQSGKIWQVGEYANMSKDVEKKAPRIEDLVVNDKFGAIMLPHGRRGKLRDLHFLEVMHPLVKEYKFANDQDMPDLDS